MRRPHRGTPSEGSSTPIRPISLPFASHRTQPPLRGLCRSSRWAQSQERLSKFGDRSNSARPFSRTSVLTPTQAVSPAAGESRPVSRTRSGSLVSSQLGGASTVRSDPGQRSARTMNSESSSCPLPEPSARLLNALVLPARPELPDLELLRELMCALLGIEGKVVRFDDRNDRFTVDEQAGVPAAARRLALRVAECGWLYRRVRRYTDARKAERSFGTVGQSFCSALHSQLTEYYRLLASLEAQMLQEVRRRLLYCFCACKLSSGVMALW